MIVLLVLYPLSIGPAAGVISWLGRSSPAGNRMNEILTTFYRPLIWIAEKSPTLLEWIWNYVRWFAR